MVEQREMHRLRESTAGQRAETIGREAVVSLPCESPKFELLAESLGYTVWWPSWECALVRRTIAVVAKVVGKRMRLSKWVAIRASLFSSPKRRECYGNTTITYTKSTSPSSPAACDADATACANLAALGALSRLLVAFAPSLPLKRTAPFTAGPRTPARRGSST